MERVAVLGRRGRERGVVRLEPRRLGDAEVGERLGVVEDLLDEVPDATPSGSPNRRNKKQPKNNPKITSSKTTRVLLRFSPMPIARRGEAVVVPVEERDERNGHADRAAAQQPARGEVVGGVDRERRGARAAADLDRDRLARHLGSSSTVNLKC